MKTHDIKVCKNKILRSIQEQYDSHSVSLRRKCVYLLIYRPHNSILETTLINGFVPRVNLNWTSKTSFNSF